MSKRKEWKKKRHDEVNFQMLQQQGKYCMITINEDKTIIIVMWVQESRICIFIILQEKPFCILISFVIYSFLHLVLLIKIKLLWLQTSNKFWIVYFNLNFANQQKTQFCPKCQLQPSCSHIITRYMQDLQTWWHLR